MIPGIDQEIHHIEHLRRCAVDRSARSLAPLLHRRAEPDHAATIQHPSGIDREDVIPIQLGQRSQAADLIAGGRKTKDRHTRCDQIAAAVAR